MNIVCSKAERREWEALEITQWQHTWEYGTIQELVGRTIERIIIRASDDGELLGYCLVVTYPLVASHTISYLPYGPVWTSTPSPQANQILQQYLHTYACTQSSIAVRQEIKSSNKGLVALGEGASKASFQQPRSQAAMSLTPSLEDITGAFSSSTRRRVKRAINEDFGLKIVSGEEMLDYQKEFIALERANSLSHGIASHSQNYFEALFTVLSRNQNNVVVIVTHSNVICAMHIITIFGTRAYCPFGVSTPEGKKLGAYYYLKWKTLEYLRGIGVLEWNWGGVQSGVHDQHLAGVGAFKAGWGTSITRQDPLCDLVVKPYWYWLYRAYAFLRRLGRRDG